MNTLHNRKNPISSPIRTHSIFAAILMVLQCHAALAQFSGGGSMRANPASCLSEADRQSIEQGLQEYTRNYGPLSRAPERGAAIDPNPYTFYPMGGTLYEDIRLSNFVDLDPTSGILDWDCTDISYNGHNAHDASIRSFLEQVIGVPIYAVQDGTVVDTHDGEFDMNTVWEGQPANYVIIDHGNGRIVRYWHMKTNSVQVTVGQVVRAGEQIGLIGSSGNSTGPHLHFATYENGIPIEPNAGNCRTGNTLWTDQVPIRRDHFVWDVGITNQPVTGLSRLDGLPRDPHIQLTDPLMYVWIRFSNRPSNSTYRRIIRRPDSSVYLDSGGTFSDTNAYRSGWWWFSFSNPGTLATLGTWQYDYYENDLLLISVPFEIELGVVPGINRAPAAVDVVFEPAAPTVDDVVVAKVLGSLVLEDPDYDVVEYEYVWTVDGEEVRRVTTAARSDALPHHTAGADNLLEVTVTPSDGALTAPPDSISITVDGEGLGGSEVWADFAYSGIEYGTEVAPINTLAESIILVTSGGTINIKGDTLQNVSPGSMTLSKPMRIQGINGLVQLGGSEARNVDAHTDQSGFISQQ